MNGQQNIVRDIINISKDTKTHILNTRGDIMQNHIYKDIETL
jgi:hypothetical protein